MGLEVISASTKSIESKLTKNNLEIIVVTLLLLYLSVGLTNKQTNKQSEASTSHEGFLKAFKSGRV